MGEDKLSAALPIAFIGLAQPPSHTSRTLVPMSHCIHEPHLIDTATISKECLFIQTLHKRDGVAFIYWYYAVTAVRELGFVIG